jgi:TolA-binding protein
MIGSTQALRRVRVVSARLLATSAAATLLAYSAMPAQAQDSTAGRLDKVEAQVRALQRKVFPGGDGRFFEPQISAPAPTANTPQSPTSSPVTDLLSRMQAVEAQMSRLTAQVEQNTNRINQLEAKLGGGNVNAPAAPATVPAPTPETGPATSESGGATVQPASATNARAATVAPSASRLQAVQAIVKPQTNDPGDDEYSYGFRLWEAEFYPEAQQQLKLFLEKYPKHQRASWGRNLLGRAYLDDGNALEAAKWFVQNYQTDKNGARAPDSLLYLGVAMKQLKDTKRACIALAEFSQAYAAEAAGRLRGLYESTRNGLNCG